MRIAFIANNRSVRLFRRNPSFVYRCENVAAWLADQGHEVRLCHIRHAPKPHEVDAAVFHRPRASLGLKWRLWRYRRAGVATVADFDDLIFDEGLVRYSPAIRNGRLPLLVQWRIFRLHRRTLAWFDRVTVSTATLAAAVRRLFPGKDARVLVNSVHWAWRQDAALAPTRPAWPRVIAYMPGTRSHDRDFAGVAGQLQRFLRDFPDTVLRITGPLEFKLDVRRDQVIHEEKVPFADYPSLFSDIWVNLAPLEETPFNRCKSALKILEAGYMGVPTLCSSNPDMARFSSAGALIVPHDGWYETLVRLRDDVYYGQVTNGLREKVLARADVADQANALLELISQARRDGDR